MFDTYLRPMHPERWCPMKTPWRPKGNLAVFALLIVGLAILGGCRTTEKRYTLHGRVVGKSVATGQISVNHEDIPGFMPAMSMSYSVKDLQGLNQVQPGDVVTADVVVANKDTYWLEHLAVTDKSGRGAVSEIAPHQLLPGESVPDVPLTNQDNKTLHLDQFKGKAVLVTFIYTRCPLPTFCPLISTEFAQIHRELAKTPSDYDKSHLVSVSLDPAYDTPPVLRKYGLAYLQDDASGFQHWDFAATSSANLKTLATAFGLEYFQQDNQIAHSMSTVLLAPDGTVAMSWPGNEWKTGDVLATMHRVITTAD